MDRGISKRQEETLGTDAYMCIILITVIVSQNTSKFTLNKSIKKKKKKAFNGDTKKNTHNYSWAHPLRSYTVMECG